MNYFSHYLLLSEPINPYKTIGCILPDLVRDKKIQSAHLQNDISPTNVPFESLHLGITHHFEVDARFHNSSFFKQFTSQISKAIRDSPEISLSKYTYFVAHILLELYLDHILVNEQKIKLDSFYHYLQKADDAVLQAYFGQYLPNNDYELFSLKKDKFVQRKFLYDYQTTDRLGSLISYILQKVGIEALSTKEEKVVVRVIDKEFGEKIRRKVPEVFESLKKNL